MKRLALISFCFVTISLSGFSQTSAQGQNAKESFSEFRNRILNNYDDFRKTILDHYADFLNGEWHEYESLNGLNRNPVPKPVSPPKVDSKRPDYTPGDTEADIIEETIVETLPGSEPSLPSSLPQPEFPVMAEESQPQSDPFNPFADSGSGNFWEFDFKGMPMVFPEIDFNISNHLNSTSDYATHWKKLEDAKVAGRMVPSIKKASKAMGLNNFLTYKFVESLVDSKFANADQSSRLSLIHYLLVNMGYDVRIAMTTNKVPMLLIPFDHMVYAIGYLVLDGKKYYLFPPENYDLNKLLEEKVLTCTLPSDVNIGEPFNLLLGELKIPVKPKKFDLSYGNIHLKGEVNENLMHLLYKYPQMPIGMYAQSELQPGLRRELIRQIKSQLEQMDVNEGVESLLQFTQNVFDYATDQAYHGFEKPYFLEETLYYPKNDCEDRAIFYTYFLHNALGREAQLLSFPGHEAAAVTLAQPIGGTSYKTDGRVFYISDPTFIGASTGMVMPTYKNVKPEVDYTYK